MTPKHCVCRIKMKRTSGMPTRLAMLSDWSKLLYARP